MPTNKRDTWTSFSVSVFARLMVPTSISKSAFECHIFFIQAEDGIRDIGVTGVQTCALPISGVAAAQAPADPGPGEMAETGRQGLLQLSRRADQQSGAGCIPLLRHRTLAAIAQATQSE